MAATVAALALAHVLADYVFQTIWMVRTKRGVGFAVHIAIVFLTAALCLGQVSMAVLLVTAAHLGIDAFKTIALPDRVWSYLADQALHLGSILLIAAWMPGAWHSGLWASSLPEAAPWAMAVAAGLIFATRAGQFAVGMLLSEVAGGAENGRASAWVGLAERSVAFIAILTGVIWIAAAALLAKLAHVGRWRQGRARGLLGTGASFAWAAMVAALTLTLIAALPPLAP